METLINKPRGSKALYVLAHGAGAGMRHSFMESAAERLAGDKVATLRYEFPYMQAGRRGRPDSPRIAQATVQEAVAIARKKYPKTPLIAGGKSFGGRMTSQAAAEGMIDSVRGIVFLGFPLHAPGRVSDDRAAHLNEVKQPMLFIQGTRDSLADLDLMKNVCKKLGKRATLHIVEGGDHSFKVPKKLGGDANAVMADISNAVSTWVEGVV